MSDETKQYKVLGAEGENIEIAGTEYPCGTGALVDLTEEQAAPLLTDGKIELASEQEKETE